MDRPAETIRTVYGFPAEVLQAATTLDNYAGAGLIEANPFARPASFLASRFRSVAEREARPVASSLGVDFSGDFAVLARALKAMGFRRFATAPRTATNCG